MLNSYENLKTYCPSFVNEIENGSVKLVQLVELDDAFICATIDFDAMKYYIGKTYKADTESLCIDEYEEFNFKLGLLSKNKIPESIIKEINDNFLTYLYD